MKWFQKHNSVLMIAGIFVCIFFIGSLTAKAEATTLNAFSSFSHSAWSADYGTKTFKYKSDYIANQYNSSPNKYVNNHDLFAYKCPSDTIYPPEIGNGTVAINNVYMQDTSTGYLYSQLNSNYFSNGSYYSRMYCGGALTFRQIKSPTAQSSSNTRTYTNRVDTIMGLDNNWTPFIFTGDYIWTQSY